MTRLAELDIRKELHLKEYRNRDVIPHAHFMLYEDEWIKNCIQLNSVKFLNDFVYNIFRCVNVSDCKRSGIKSNDAHIFMQRLLLVASGGYLRHDICLPLMKLSTLFRKMCVGTCKKDVLKCFVIQYCHHSLHDGKRYFQYTSLT